MVTPTPDRNSKPRPRRAGRFFVLLAGLILLGAAGAAIWLQQTHKLQDLTEQPPAIAVQIPDEAAEPAETATSEPAPAVADTGGSTSVPTAPAPATTETMASPEPPPSTATTETSVSPEPPPPPSAATTETTASAEPPPAPSTATTETMVSPEPPPPPSTSTTETTGATESSTATATAEPPATTTAVPPPAPSAAEMTAAAEAPATTETPAASTATAEPALPTTAEATAPPPPTPVAESEPTAETALPVPAIPLPRLKPPPPAAPAPTLTATAESTAATAEATLPTPATASPGASLGSAATASAVTAPAATETTQTASAAAPAASNGGEPPWKRNSRPFPADDPRPRVSLVISGLGLTAAQTQAAIDQLPPEITLGFSPYSGDLEDWIAKARAAGHEVLIELPMEPLNYPADDPGPQALLASLSPAENLKRLDWVLARSNQMIGLVANMGSRFQANARLIRPILTRLAEKGYLYVDNRSGPTSVISEVAASVDLPWTYNTRFIDAEATRVSIDGRLQQLERTAREKGFALGLAQGYPVTIERVAAWAKSLEVKGLALAPASALAKTGAQ